MINRWFPVTALLACLLCGCSPSQVDLLQAQLDELKESQTQAGESKKYEFEMRIRILESTLALETGQLKPAAACRARIGALCVTAELVSTTLASRYPESLSEAVPKWLDEIPTCPESGQPYRYETSGQKGPPDYYIVGCDFHKTEKKQGPL